jgi:hypothetical protein
MSKKAAAASATQAPLSYETSLDKLVKIELLTINGKDFFGQVSDDELLYIWVAVFGRKKEELFGVTSTRTLTRHVRGTFKLNSAIKLQDVYGSSNFAYEKFLDDGSNEEITGRILGYDAVKPAEIGDLVRVTVKTNLGVESTGVVTWLRLYGSLTSKQNFIPHPTTGLNTDTFEAEIILKRHIEEFLPMYGQKVVVNYPGIPRMCNRCYLTGHMRRECNNKKREWIQYIIDLLDAGLSIELIGTWKAAVSRFKKANANPEDASKIKE